MDGFLKVTGYHVRERTPDGKLSYRYIETWKRYHHRDVPAHWVIHHKDGNMSNDRIENLEAMPMWQHELIHQNYFLNNKTKASIRLGRLKGPGQRVKK
jgi:hypothetical protein